MELRELFTPSALAIYYNSVASNRIPYLGSVLFPNKKKAGLDLSWLKGSNGLPVSLKPSAFDAKATFRDRIGVQKVETEMPFFREGFKINEKDRQEILRVQDSNDPYAQEVINRIYDDAAALVDGANVVPERMIMQLLFPENGSAGISIKANGVDYTYNYDADGKWKASNYVVLTTNDKWSAAATADPFKNFKDLRNKAAANTGVELVRAVMNSTTFEAMAKAEAIKNRYLTTNGLSLGYLTESEVKAVIKDTVGITIAVYDKQFKDENGTAQKFVPDGYVALLPEGNLGNTWYGTTPEEADLRASSKASVSIVNTGVALTTILEEHPVNINTFASEIVLPSFERMDDVYCMKVLK